METSAVKFEVFGKVQGVYFRKHTKSQAQQLGILGWVKNTRRGTVIGKAQATTEQMSEFCHWLRHVGSPKSEITNLVLESTQPNPAFKSFIIKK